MNFISYCDGLMSGDETVVLIVSSIAALCSWMAWLVGCCRAQRSRAPQNTRVIAAIMPIVCAILLLIVLLSWSSFDVRSSGLYTFFYLVFGAAWMGLALFIQPLVGISLRDDVLERRNSAALSAISGSLIGLTFCFAGANIGDGPGWWVVLFSAVLSTGAWLLFWIIYEATTHASEHITVDRDPAAGWRMAGYLTATGMIFGRAVAGDWQSATATIQDAFILAWPALVLLVIAIVVEKLFRPTVERPTAPLIFAGYIPAVLYVSAAVIWIYSIGPGN